MALLSWIKGFIVGLGVRGAWVMCEFKRDRGGWRSKVSCSFQILQDISKAGQQPYAFRETRVHYSRGPLLNWTRVQTQGGGAEDLSLSLSLSVHMGTICTAGPCLTHSINQLGVPGLIITYVHYSGGSSTCWGVPLRRGWGEEYVSKRAGPPPSDYSWTGCCTNLWGHV